ncbi:kinesin-domain-containing protein [Trichocladium antarcticum]|uniref:Kinesin-domain-containing protein n=1 Tax=Trichocladium antarcticum TaxID=1450529 RepID=A0AAN6UHN9_9PEZI|nr:kinesin-domain-containing protein [Trichocladium antarcticum]
MAGSPPGSPSAPLPARPLSAMIRPAPRSNSRMSTQSRTGGGSRASDEDTKTAVKVAVRVRPSLQPTDPGYELIPQRFQRPMLQVQTPTNLSIDSPQGRKLFVFDRVFDSNVDQAGVWEYLEECITAFTQGYNVSLLAYGQSGAGKSYTMGTSGPAEQSDNEVMGVIPRAAAALFEKLEGPKRNPNRNSMSQLRSPRYSTTPASLAQAEKNWTLRASYVEIYNEQLRDLLIPEDVLPQERGTVSIREDVKGNILLAGLHQIEVNSVEDLMNALNQGSALRQTDATAINARSSRSHAVFSLHLVQKKSNMQAGQGAEKRFSMPLDGLTGAETLVTTDSKMHFVDLAGSERLKNTGAQGERAKEGISINGGLAALGKVISQLSSRQPGSHVSYRDSKLTRLLQDSLGGNAITYMIACVTPAEFHLSETLNTVQYAQRARAIQSKPRIQQVEEGDKQAIIDRLKAEVAFLREQIRSAERGGGEGRTLGPGERSARQNEREAELQNRLLDSEEKYETLGQRHAKLIAEMAKARENERAENLLHEETAGDSATERLNRSNSFAQAVEQVVLEYEKTIQSLEHSIASTRATLAITEGSLLEKETRVAYTDTINNQLQARLQKLVDREASTENYLHDLEAKLDGHTSGEEKNATIITELRKEIARVREHEATCEDYISTIEERLAEADQDAELMQREIDRLEQVVERQRSLGKLDSLLYELDTIQQDAPPAEADTGMSNGAGHRRTASRSIAEHSRSQSHVSRHSQMEETIPESGEEDMPEDIPEEAEAPVDDQKTAAEATTPTPLPAQFPENGEAAGHAANPAATRFVADKLDTVTQELFGLRVEHESTLNEYELLHAKYEEALRALAELQDVVDETRHPSRQRDSLLSVASPLQTRPFSFFSDARTNETKDSAHLSHLSSRSLSSELSSAMDSPATTVEPSDAETAVPRPDSHASLSREAANASALASEIERLQYLAAERQSAERELTERYAQLENQHQQTLDMVEELKTEVAKAQAANTEASSPRGTTPVIRRKSSQNVMIIDRAHRSFASLRNIAAENFENQPDVMQNFDLNLNAAMHELHARSERIQELEADVATAKKEMETKMTIISGLTRERSSMKAASPMDMAMVSTLREQLGQSEMRIREMQEGHGAREKELEAQLAELQESLKQATAAAEESAASATSAAEDLAAQAALRGKISELETQLASREVKAGGDSEKEVEAQLAELKESLKQATVAAEESATAAKLAAEHSATEIQSREKRVSELEAELASREVKAGADVKREVEAQLAELRESLQQATVAAEESAAAATLAAENAATEIQSREARISELEAELASWEERHNTALQGIQDAEKQMKQTIGELEAQVASASAQLTEAERKKPEEEEALRAAEAKHKNLVDFLRSEMDEYKTVINTSQSRVSEAEHQHLATKKLLEIATQDRDQATDDRDQARGEAEAHKQLVAKLETQISDHEQTIKEYQGSLHDLQSKHSEDIEEIMSTSRQEYETKLSALKAEHATRIVKLEAELTEAREDLMRIATEVAFALGLDASVERITERIQELVATQQALVQEQEKRAELERHVVDLSNINDTVMRDLETVRADLSEVLDAKAEQAKSPYAVREQIVMVKKKVVDLETKNKKNSRLVEELEDQLQNNYDQVQMASNRLSTLQMERNVQLEEANAAKLKLQAELDAIREDYASVQAKYEGITANDGMHPNDRSNSLTNAVRQSPSVASLPSPPPAIPLPPLPNGGSNAGTTSPTGPRPASKDVNGPASIAQIQEDQEARIRLIEKHLKAEKQLTATLEEALTDLERQQNAIRADGDAWRRRATELEAELKELKDKPAQDNRWSLQQVEEERRKRRDAEVARAHLEERMNTITPVVHVRYVSLFATVDG